MKWIVCCALALVGYASVASAASDCCERCGCDACCRKVCRLVCETKKVPKVTYSCECEDFCVPGPSHRSVECDDCGKKKYVYTPTCAQVRTRKKLVKKETMEDKPSYKWVVETVCDACACDSAAPAAQELPRMDAPTAATAPPVGSSDVLRASFRPPLAEGPINIEPASEAEPRGRVRSDLRRLLEPLFGQK